METPTASVTPTALVTFGYSTKELASWLHLNLAAADAVQREVMGIAQSKASRKAFNAINPARLLPNPPGPHAGFGDLVWGMNFLASHPNDPTYPGKGSYISTLTPKPVAPKLAGLITFGFTTQDIEGYMLTGDPWGAEAVQRMTLGMKQTPSTLAALKKIPIRRFKPPYAGPGLGDIPWGMQHLAEHPAGSHYHGDFNVVNIVANVATGGLYGVATGLIQAAQGNLKAGIGQALASTGVAGSVLQPTIGTTKTLVLESIVAGGALAAAPAGAILGTVVPAEGLIASTGLSVGTKLLTASAGSPASPTSSPTSSKTRPGQPTSLVSSLLPGNPSPLAPAPYLPSGPGASSPVVTAGIGGVAILGLIFLLRRFL